MTRPEEDAVAAAATDSQASSDAVQPINAQQQEGTAGLVAPAASVEQVNEQQNTAKALAADSDQTETAEDDESVKEQEKSQSQASNVLAIEQVTGNRHAMDSEALEAGGENQNQNQNLPTKDILPGQQSSSSSNALEPPSEVEKPTSEIMSEATLQKDRVISELHRLIDEAKVEASQEAIVESKVIQQKDQVLSELHQLIDETKEEVVKQGEVMQQKDQVISELHKLMDSNDTVVKQQPASRKINPLLKSNSFNNNNRRPVSLSKSNSFSNRPAPLVKVDSYMDVIGGDLGTIIESPAPTQPKRSVKKLPLQDSSKVASSILAFESTVQRLSQRNLLEEDASLLRGIPESSPADHYDSEVLLSQLDEQLEEDTDDDELFPESAKAVQRKMTLDKVSRLSQRALENAHITGKLRLQLRKNLRKPNDSYPEPNRQLILNPTLPFKQAKEMMAALLWPEVSFNEIDVAGLRGFLFPSGEEITSLQLLRDDDVVAVSLQRKRFVTPAAADEPSSRSRRHSDKVDASQKRSLRSFKKTAKKIQVDIAKHKAGNNGLSHALSRLHAVTRHALKENKAASAFGGWLHKERLEAEAKERNNDTLSRCIEDMCNVYKYTETRPDPKGKQWLLYPNDSWRVCWDVFILSLVVFYVVVVPIRFAFDMELSASAENFDIVTDLLFIVDVGFNLFTTYKVEGMWEQSNRKVAVKYLTGYGFIDILSSLPVGWFSSGSEAKVNKLFRTLKLFKLFRMFRLGRYFTNIATELKFNPSLVRFFKSLGVLMMVWHLIGCIYWFVSVENFYQGIVPCSLADCYFDVVQQGFKCIALNTTKCFKRQCIYSGTCDIDHLGSNLVGYVAADLDHADEELGDLLYGLYPDVWVPHPEYANATHMRQYLHSVFWAVEATTGIGNEIVPKTGLQIFFTICIVIVGLGLYSVIIGSASSALTSIDSLSSIRRREADKMSETLRNQKVPAFFIKIIIEYYQHKWACPTDEQQVLAGLPESLQIRLSLILNRELVNQIKIFEKFSADAFIKIVQKLETMLFLPGEFVETQGEECRALYFIKDGRVDQLVSLVARVNLRQTVEQEVKDAFEDYVSEHDIPKEHIVKTYNAGDYFGEHGLLLHCSRRSTFRSINYVDLLLLSKKDFHRMVATVPPVMEELEFVNKERQHQIDVYVNGFLDRYLRASNREALHSSAASSRLSAATSLSLSKRNLLAETSSGFLTMLGRKRTQTSRSLTSSLSSSFKKNSQSGSLVFRSQNQRPARKTHSVGSYDAVYPNRSIE